MMKKKMLAAAMTVLMVISTVGCRGNSNAGNVTTAAQNTAAGSENTSTSVAAEWPAGKTIEVEVPAKAGGGSDLTARYMTEALGKITDGTFVVNNYDTEVARNIVKEAKPDGTKLINVISSAMLTYLTGTSEVHPIEDGTVIGKMFAGTVNVVITYPDAPYNNFKELKEYVDANPGKVITGVTVGGASQLLFMNLGNSMGGLDLNYVQCSSESDKLANTASKSLDLTNCNLNNAIAYARDGKIKILGTVAWSDDATLKDISEMAGEELGDEFLTSMEQGYEGGAWTTGTYLVGPAGMDQALVQTINDILMQLPNDADYCAKVLKQGQVMDFKNVEDSVKDYNELYELMVKLSTDAGINVRN